MTLRPILIVVGVLCALMGFLWIGKGLGRQLFERAAEEARLRGARRLEWEAEPNATGFYERMGGTYVRDSELTEWGRVLHVLGVDLR